MEQTVIARDFRPGKGKWLEATVKERIGSYLHAVKIGDQVVKRHSSQLLARRGPSIAITEDMTAPDESNPSISEQGPAPAANLPVLEDKAVQVPCFTNNTFGFSL